MYDWDAYASIVWSLLAIANPLGVIPFFIDIENHCGPKPVTDPCAPLRHCIARPSAARGVGLQTFWLGYVLGVTSR